MADLESQFISPNSYPCYSKFVKRILLIEDDERLALQLTKVVVGEGFLLDTIASKNEVLDALNANVHYDLIVLDRMLGSMDLRDKLPEIKIRWPDTSILVISTISTPTERAEVINLGADDYLGKPFITDEFVARVRSLARRLSKKNSDIRIVGNSICELTLRRISVGTQFENLPAKEFTLFTVLSANPGKVLSREELLKSVWGCTAYAETNLVEVTLGNLRRRLANISCNFEIKNQRGIGYWIEVKA